MTAIVMDDGSGQADQLPVATQKPWQQRARKKCRQRDAQVEQFAVETLGKPQPTPCPAELRNVKEWPVTCGDLTRRQLEITATLPSILLGKLAAGTWTAEEVLRAFIARTIVAHYLTNPLAEPFFARGLARARELDEHLRVTGKPVGQLHGLPMSFKDALHIQGLPTTVGAVALVDQVYEDSDAVISRLHDAGAVFYCKTNVPQFLMSGECVNYIYGRTSTPHNRNLSAGGSSGGEGSLIALGGSPLGIGSDIAGSIRTPANFNGIYGLCPSTGRLPCHSAKYASPNFVIDGVTGPMSRSVDGLEVYMRALLDLKPWEWDYTCSELPWNEQAYNQAANNPRACIGIVHHDGVMTPHPPIQRAVREVKQALLDTGHEVLDIPLFDGSENLWALAAGIFWADGDVKIRKLVRESGEPFIKELDLGRPEDVLDAQGYKAIGREIHTLRQRFLERWRATAAQTSRGRPVDVFILPSGAHVAPPHGTMRYFLYEAISNILDWTCATIPVGKVDAAVDLMTPGELAKPLSEGDRGNWQMCMCDPFFSSFLFPRVEANRPSVADSLDAYIDSPICLQVLGQRRTEEKVLGYLRLIDRALGRGADFQT
jgi:amidase